MRGFSGRWVVLACTIVTVSAAYPAASVAETEPSVNWDLSDLYPGTDAWSAAYSRTRAQVEQFG